MKNSLSLTNKSNGIFEKDSNDLKDNNVIKILVDDIGTEVNEQIVVGWAKQNNATDLFVKLWNVYNELYKLCGNVNPIIAYIQAAIETNFGEFKGELKEEFNNPYGIKEFKYDDEGVLIEEYTRFNSWEEGVEAHLDHLALYFGADGYPKENSKDSRHFYYLYGICSNISDLQGKWNSKKGYSNKILDEIKNIYTNNYRVINELDIINNLENENKVLKEKLNKYEKLVDDLKKILNCKIE